MSTSPAERTLFFFEKPSAMRQLQRFFKSSTTSCVAAEGHLLAAQEPGDVRPEWKTWRFEALPIVLDAIPVRPGENRFGPVARAQARGDPPGPARRRPRRHRHRPGARGLDDRLGGAGAPRLDGTRRPAQARRPRRPVDPARLRRHGEGARLRRARLRRLPRSHLSPVRGLSSRPQRHPGHLAAPQARRLPRALALRRRADPDARHPGRPRGAYPLLRAARLLQGRPARHHPGRGKADAVARAEGPHLRARGRGSDPRRRGALGEAARGRAEGRAAPAAEAVLQGHAGAALCQALWLGPAAHRQARPGAVRRRLPVLSAHGVRAPARKARWAMPPPWYRLSPRSSPTVCPSCRPQATSCSGAG